MIKIDASEFRTRSDLENCVKSFEFKEGEAIIVGEARHLKQFQLSATTKVWGLKCEVLPDTKKNLGNVKVQRGTKKKRNVKRN